MRSVGAVFLGMLLAVVIWLILIAGIVGPAISAIFGFEAGQRLVLPSSVLIFALAFYFGGMIAAYRAPFRRRLHALLVGVCSYAISLGINFWTFFFIPTQQDPLANLRTPRGVVFTAILLIVSIAASYVGGRRGESLYFYNLRFSKQGKRKDH